jgi:hypothetical protein
MVLVESGRGKMRAMMLKLGRVVAAAFVFGLAQSARADVCCPSGCVPLNNGKATCVKAGTNQSCGTGSICNSSGGGSAGGSNGQGGSTVAPIVPPGSCGLYLQCSYANGVATVSIVNSSGTHYTNPPKEWVYTRVVYAKGCVGGGAALSIPVDGKATLNLLTLQYHNLCTNELPMSFRARIGAFPETVGSCDCSFGLPAPPYGPASCRQGFVWRNAFDGDVVCVTPARQTQVQAENANAGSTRAGAGASGPNTCKNGFVWRAARPSDLVCVTIQSRAQVKSENDTAWDRVAHIAGQ